MGALKRPILSKKTQIQQKFLPKTIRAPTWIIEEWNKDYVGGAIQNGYIIKITTSSFTLLHYNTTLIDVHTTHIVNANNHIWAAMFWKKLFKGIFWLRYV